MDAETYIHAALMARAESMTLDPVLPLQYPGVSAPDFSTSGEYGRITHLANEPDRWGVKGTSAMDRTGFLQIDLFTPIDEASWQVLALKRAGEIAAHFPADLKLSSGGFEVQIQKVWPGNGRPDPEGTHWHTPVNVEYRGTA